MKKEEGEDLFTDGNHKWTWGLGDQPYDGGTEEALKVAAARKLEALDNFFSDSSASYDVTTL